MTERGTLSNDQKTKEPGFRDLFEDDRKFKVRVVAVSIIVTIIAATALVIVQKADAISGGVGPSQTKEEVPLSISYAGLKGCELRTFGRMAPPTRSTYRLKLRVDSRGRHGWEPVTPGRATGINRKGQKPGLTVWLNPDQVDRMQHRRYRVVITQQYETTVHGQPDVPGALTAYRRIAPIHHSDCVPDVVGQD